MVQGARPDGSEAKALHAQTLRAADSTMEFRRVVSILHQGLPAMVDAWA